jgi:dTDP-4-dehydrorhamnose reductase
MSINHMLANKSILLVTGATGLLGNTLVPHLKNCGYRVVTHARKSEADILFDLSNRFETIEVLDRVQPDFIINLASLTSVELCEEQPNEAYLANTRTVENLAYWVSQSGKSCHLVQISTDHVYDHSGLHSENEITLTNTYALTKYAGELAASSVPSTILRTNFVGRSKTKKRESLSDWVYNSIRFEKNVLVLEDVFFSPLSMHTLVKMIERVIENRPVGVFNLGSRGGMSKADFDFLLANKISLSTATMSRVKSDQADFLKAYRPKDMRMDCTLFEKTFGIKLPYLVDEIDIIASEYDETT